MALAGEMPDCLHLEVGEPDFPTPPHIVEAACRAARDGFTRYTPNAGITPLREALVEKLRQENGLAVSVENITITSGAVNAIFAAIFSTVDPDEEVLLPDPGWPNFELVPRCYGAKVVRYSLDKEQDFTPADFDAMDRLVSEKTKAIVVNSPSNPSGSVFPPETVKRLVEFAQRHDLYLISDETYEDIVFAGQHISPARFDAEGRVLGLFSFSKSYAMTGWRVGYLVASAEISSVARKIHEPTISCVSSISQAAALAALQGPRHYISEMVTAYRRRRDLAVEILKEYDLFSYLPQGAFYTLVDISSCGMNSYSFARSLLAERKVAVAPGETFGPAGGNFVRVSFSNSDETIAEGMRRLCEYIHARRSR